MLPDGWKRSALGEIAQVTSGGTPDRSEPSYWGGSIPWVTTGEIKFKIITDTAEKITEAGLKYSAAKKFPPGTLLMAMYGQGKTRGQVAKLGIEATTNQACAAILLNQDEDTEFFYQFLASHYDAIRELSNAGGQKNLSGSLIKGISVPVPPIREQQKIARVLATWDEAIKKMEQLLANSYQQKRALMQRLLTGKHGEKTWLYHDLNEIARRIQRKSDGADHPVLMISSGTGFVRQDEKYSRFMAGKSLDDYILLKQGEFAYNKGNSKIFEFGCVFPLEKFVQGLVPHVYVCFELNDKCIPSFFKYLFEADYLHDQLGALVNTGVRNNGLLNIKPTDFMNVRVPLPPLEEQKYLAQILDTATNEIVQWARDLSLLKEHKRALMQQILTGKRRVKLDKITAEEIAA